MKKKNTISYYLMMGFIFFITVILITCKAQPKFNKGYGKIKNKQIIHKKK
jgi:hypothetical protein